MARPRKREAVNLKDRQEVFQRAYQEWKPWAGYHSHLTGKRLAFEGARTGIGAIYEKQVMRVFLQLDRAIIDLVSADKIALGDPKVLERIEQAQWLGDKTFFEGLALAVRANVGIDRRMAEDPIVAVIYNCAVKYLHGDTKCIKEAYYRWKKMDFEGRRKEKPRDKSLQALLNQWQIGKDAIMDMGLEHFRARVKRMAEQLRRGSMPIPTPIDKNPRR